MAAFLPGKGAKVQHRFRESPLRFDEKPLDAAGMSKDKSAKIPTPQPVRGTQDMLGDFADRFAHVVETFERVRRLYGRSEEHTSELQSLMRISYAVFCLKNKN